MASATLQGKAVKLSGSLPEKGAKAPSFSLVAKDLSEATPANFAGKKLVLNIFPSVDTSVCAASVRRFNREAGSMKDAVVLCVSMDLPFAQARFCGAEGLSNVVTLSAFRSPKFAQDYGVKILDGPLKGLLARAVVVVGQDGKVLHSQLVPEITQEPDYQAALNVLK